MDTSLAHIPKQDHLLGSLNISEKEINLFVWR